MKNINSDVEEVEEVNEVKDKEPRDLRLRKRPMCQCGMGFSFTSFISFTSSTSFFSKGACL